MIYFGSRPGVIGQDSMDGWLIHVSINDHEFGALSASTAK